MFVKKFLRFSLIAFLLIGSLFAKANLEVAKMPSITSLDPSQGPVSTEVLISGKGFGKEKGKVIFYSYKNAPIVSWSDQEIICQVPAGAKSGKVVVKDKNGNKSEGVKFTVLVGVLPPPAGLKIEHLTDKTVTIKWNKVNNAVGYSISFGTDKKATNLKTINLKSTTYDKLDLTPNKTYYCKVKALGSDTKKNSPWSRVISFKTKAEAIPVAAPTEASESAKKTNFWNVVIVGGVIFVVLLAALVVVRLFLRRRSSGLEEALRPEPEEESLPKPPPSPASFSSEIPPPPPTPPKVDNIKHPPSRFESESASQEPPSPPFEAPSPPPTEPSQPPFESPSSPPSESPPSELSSPGPPPSPPESSPPSPSESSEESSPNNPSQL